MDGPGMLNAQQQGLRQRRGLENGYVMKIGVDQATHYKGTT
jgi:hypothetical protein